mgnify:CR=1 FL=1
MILDNSEESVIILSNRKINYVNKKFLNKYKSLIMKYQEIEHGEQIISDSHEQVDSPRSRKQ